MYTEKKYKKDCEKLQEIILEQHKTVYTGNSHYDNKKWEKLRSQRLPLQERIEKYNTRFIGKYVKFTAYEINTTGEVSFNKTVKYAYILNKQDKSKPYEFKCLVLEPLVNKYVKGKLVKREPYYIDTVTNCFEEITADEWKSLLAKTITNKENEEIYFAECNINNYIKDFINQNPTKEEKALQTKIDKLQIKIDKLAKQKQIATQKYNKQCNKHRVKMEKLVTEEIFNNVLESGKKSDWHNIDCDFLKNYAKPKKKQVKKK